MPKPSRLPFGVLPSLRDRFSRRLFKCDALIEISGELRYTKRARRRQVVTQPRGLEDAHLLERTSRDHRLEALRNSRVKPDAVGLQHEARETAAQRRYGLELLPLRE